MKGITSLIAAITASVTCTSGFEAWAAGPAVTNPVAVITNDSANDSNFATGLFIYFQAFNGSDTSNQTARRAAKQMQESLKKFASKKFHDAH